MKSDPTSTPEPRTFKMSRRAASPAASENEVDIFDSLYTEDHEGQANVAGADGGFDFLDGGDGEDEADGDEAFIALKQAASFRKTTNIKGKTGKKSGGFQSMGMLEHGYLSYFNN